MSAALDIAADPTIQATLHAALALLLAASAIHKLREPRAFRAALSNYALVPARAEATAAWSLAGCEAGLAVLLLVPGIGAGPALAAAALLALYGGAMALMLTRGRVDIDCGCGLASGPQPIRWGLVVRNGALAVAAAVASLPAAERPIGWLDGVDVIMAVVATALLFGGFELSGQNAARAAHLAAARSAR